MEAIFWTGVQVHAQTALATAVTVQSISKASPGVVGATGHGYSNGDYIVLSAAGMIEVNDRVFRVAAVTTDTFELEGEDTTDYATFTSGSAQEVTFGVAAATLQDVNVSGGEANFTDVNTIHDRQQRRVPTTTTPISITHTSLFSAEDAFLLEMRKASRTLTKRAVRYTFPNGSVAACNAYASASGAPTGSSGQAVQTPLALEAQGAMTVLAAA